MTPLEEQNTYCPYCGEPIQLLVDVMDSDSEYTEDCQVCCRPMVVKVLNGQELIVMREDDAY